MPGFNPTVPATGQICCSSPCASGQAADDRLSDASAARIQSLTGEAVPTNAGPDAPQQPPVPADASACAKKASTLAPVLQRFNRYRDALPSARAATDLNQLGDKAGDKASSMPCLTRLPTDGAGLTQALGLPPGSIADSDLRDDTTGFRAAMYRDESTNSLILVPRDTQPDSLVDWETNTRNGTGLDTEQYTQMRQLTGTLKNDGVDFDLAGYSKGGGMAQEAGLVNTDAGVTVFNSAGLHDNSLTRTGTDDFDSLTSRTKAFSAKGDFLTYMNNTTDPQQNLTNARFLRQELAGEGPGINPINIKTIDPATRSAKPGADFVQAKQDYLKELDDHIASTQSALDEGRAVEGFPPVRAGMKETINDSGSFAGNLLGANSDQPTLGKLYQHKTDGVLDSLESNVKDDRKTLQSFLSKCG
jgi:hypothetical protein